MIFGASSPSGRAKGCGRTCWTMVSMAWLRTLNPWLVGGYNPGMLGNQAALRLKPSTSANNSHQFSSFPSALFLGFHKPLQLVMHLQPHALLFDLWWLKHIENIDFRDLTRRCPKLQVDHKLQSKICEDKVKYLQVNHKGLILKLLLPLLKWLWPSRPTSISKATQPSHWLLMTGRVYRWSMFKATGK